MGGDVESQQGQLMSPSTEKERRSLKNLPLTREYHWNYIGAWVVTNLILIGLCDAMVLFVVARSPAHLLPWPAPRLIALSAIIALLVMAAIVFLGTVSAHRLAGVHIKLTNVLNAIGDGDFKTELKFRQRDGLEEVEQAFLEMAQAIESGTPTPGGSEFPAPEADSGAEVEKRSRSSMRLTRKHHLNYMGGWVLLTVALIALTHMCAVCTVHFLIYLGVGLPSLQVLAVLAGLSPVFCTFAIYQGFNTAHRLSGVHIQVTRVLKRVAQGERDLVLKFRASDNLGQVEKAFAHMMEAIREKESSSAHEGVATADPTSETSG